MTEDLKNRLIADKYLVGELIRSTDNDDLYAGIHEIQQRPVAIRILPTALAIDQRWSRSFLDETRRAATISDPNVLNVSDFGVDSLGVVYAIHDAVEGRDLASVMSTEGAFDQRRALNIAIQICSALDAGTKLGMVHGRLDPANIFTSITADGVELVKVAGFGADPLAVPRGIDPRYLSPELCGEYPSADARSDVFAVGAMLYTMLAGKHPFVGATKADILRNINAMPPEPLKALRPELSDRIDPVLSSALSADPEQRYQTIAALKEDLERIRTQVGGKAIGAAAASGQNIWKTALIVLVGIGLLAAAMIYATSRTGTDPTLTAKMDANALPVQPLGPATGSVEERLSGLSPETAAELMSNSNAAANAGVLPGGDGYNPWASGGQPPVGAPSGQQQAPYQYPAQPMGPTVSGDPNGGSQFMPPSDANCIPQPSGISLCYAPVVPTAQATPKVAATPKPMATPPAKGDPSATPAAANTAAGDKQPAAKPDTGKPADKPKGKAAQKGKAAAPAGGGDGKEELLD